MKSFAIRSSALAVVMFAFMLGVANAQTTAPAPIPASDPQAVAVMQRSLQAMGGIPPSDSSASGTVQLVGGSQSLSGTIQILTKGVAQTLELVTTDLGEQSTVFSNGSASETTNGTITTLSLEIAVTSQSCYFPLPLFTQLANDVDTRIAFVGAETLNGSQTYHLRMWDSFASQPDYQDLASLTTRDIWIDTTSALPLKISFVRKPAHGAVAGTAVEVLLTNYQTFGGLLYPTSIRTSRSGVPWANISIQSVSFNNGLTDSNFAVK